MGVSAPAVFRFAGSWTELTGNATTGTNGSYTYASADTPGFSSFLIGQSGNIPTAIRLQDLGAGSGRILGLLWVGLVALVGIQGLAAFGLVLRKRGDQL